MYKLEQLKQQFPYTGRVEWIGIRTNKATPMTVLQEIEARQDHGLSGDKAGKRPGGKRQVTIFQAEYIPFLQSLMPNADISLTNLRRNISISGINLNALKDQTIQVGEAILEVTGFCHPCSKLEENLGQGVFNAMRGHGGLTAKVIESGRIALGDTVKVVYPA